MARKICGTCGRSYHMSGTPEVEDREYPDFHGICARCECIPEKDLLDEGEIFEIIKDEIRNGIVWEGEDASDFSAEDLGWYEGLLGRAIAETREDGSQSRK